jgi:transcriptional regulator with XRE-family HTH domain
VINNEGLWGTEIWGLERRVRYMRLRQGWSQEDLAVSIDVSQPTISRIELGIRPIAPVELGAMADALGVSLGTFIGTKQARVKRRVAAP